MLPTVGRADPVLDEGFQADIKQVGAVNAIAVAPDGRLVIAGEFRAYDGASRTQVARLHSDGSLDETFVPDLGFVESLSIRPVGSVDAMVVQSDGRVVVGGQFTITNGGGRISLARLNADGSFDETFAAQTASANPVVAMAVQSDNKIVVGGFFAPIAGGFTRHLTRLNADGTADTTFATSAGSRVRAVGVASDGKILVGGSFHDVGSIDRERVARLNADGSVDETFDPGEGPSSDVYALAIQTDGKVIIAGRFTGVNGVARNRIARLNADGTLDETFDSGAGVNNTVEVVALQADGKVVIGGPFQTVDGEERRHIARLNVDGSLDRSFAPRVEGPGGSVRLFSLRGPGQVRALLPHGDGLLVGGNFSSLAGGYREGVALLRFDGDLDSGFDPGTGTDMGSVPGETLALQLDGRIIVGGGLTSVSGVARGGVARLNADGSLDPSFDPGVGADMEVTAVAVQADQKVLVGGWFGLFDGMFLGRLVRLQADGRLDAGFQPSRIEGSRVTSITPLSNGRVLISGSLRAEDENGALSPSPLILLNEDGSSVETTAPQPDREVITVAVQPDGRILVGGDFTRIGETAAGKIARLNTDLSLDPTFTGSLAPELNGERILASALQPDGRWIITGDFHSVNGSPTELMARLNPDGRLDSSFRSDIGLDGAPWEVALQRDGKILIVGRFTMVDGEPRNGFARLNRDGSLDRSFDPEPYGFRYFDGLTVQPNGQVLVCMASDAARLTRGVARFNVDVLPLLTIDRSSAGGAVVSWPVIDDGYTLQESSNPFEISWSDVPIEPVVVSDHNVVTNSVEPGVARLFRLWRGDGEGD